MAPHVVQENRDFRRRRNSRAERKGVLGGKYRAWKEEEVETSFKSTKR